jgi:hypothetical protein
MLLTTENPSTWIKTCPVDREELKLVFIPIIIQFYTATIIPPMLHSHIPFWQQRTFYFFATGSFVNQLDRSCEKLSSITWSQGAEEYPT